MREGLIWPRVLPTRISIPHPPSAHQKAICSHSGPCVDQSPGWKHPGQQTSTPEGGGGTHPILTVRCELVTVTVACSPREMLGREGDV